MTYSQTPAALSAPRLRLMLAALCLAALLATCAGPVLSPFLLDLTRDFGVDLVTIALLMGAMNVTWGLCALAAGWASDRLGRRRILVAGLFVLGVACAVVAGAGSAGWLLVGQIMTGVGGGSYMGVVFAAVSDRVPTAERGRALGWVITGQSLALLVGVPVFTFAGSFTGWRGAMAAEALATVVVAAVLWLSLPTVEERRQQDGAGASLSTVLRPRLLILLVAACTERVCFVSVAMYLATYFITGYGVATRELSGLLAVVALGNVVGNVVGARLADRFRARPLVFALTSLAAGAIAFPLLGTTPGLWISLGMGFLYAFVNATGRPALIAALSDVPAEVRGTVLGLNITVASVGWLTTVSFGGWLIANVGFGGLGVLGMAAGLLGCGLSLIVWLMSGSAARFESSTGRALSATSREP